MPKLQGSPESLRRQNRSNVLNCLLQHGAIDRTQLAKETGLTTTAITRITRELLDAGIIRLGDKSPLESGPGRNRTLLTFNEDGAYVVGVSLAAWERRLAIANLKGDVITEQPLELSDLKNSIQTLDEIASAIDALIAEQNLPRHRVLGIGFATAGVVNGGTGRLETAPYLGWTNVDIGGALATELDIPVAVENLNNAIVMAEAQFGCCANKQNIVLVRVGPGLGGSFVVNGQLARGRNFQAGQVGHIPVAGNSTLCACGETGCLNTLASGWAILSELGLSRPPASSAERLVQDGALLEEVIERARNKDVVVAGAARKAGEALGRMLASFYQALSPEVVMVVGPISEIDAYIEGIRRAAGANSIELPLATPSEQKFKSVASSAAMHALTQFVFSPALRLSPLLSEVAVQDGTGRLDSATP